MLRVTDLKQKVKVKIKMWEVFLGKKIMWDGTASSGTGQAKLCDLMEARRKSRNE